MFNKEIQQQQGGDHSINQQAGRDIIITGITYTDAKAIAIDVCKENFLKFSQIALEIADKRLENFVDEFLTKLNQRDPTLLNSLASPGMVAALFDAEKEYVRNGDEDSKKLLIDLLLKRAETTERDSIQIALDESLVVVGKLTEAHINAITLVFLMRFTVHNNIFILGQLKIIFEKTIKPFVLNLKPKRSFYNHISFTGAGSVSALQVNFCNIFRENYSGLFNKGITDYDLVNFSNIVTNSDYIHVPNKPLTIIENGVTRLAFTNLQELEVFISSLNTSEENGGLIRHMYNMSMMTVEEVAQKLDSFGEYMVELRDVWDKSDLRHLELTNVGIVIAIANYANRVGEELDYSVWLGD